MVPRRVGRVPALDINRRRACLSGGETPRPIVVFKFDESDTACRSRKARPIEIPDEQLRGGCSLLWISSCHRSETWEP